MFGEGALVGGEEYRAAHITDLEDSGVFGGECETTGQGGRVFVVPMDDKDVLGLDVTVGDLLFLEVCESMEELV